MKNKNKTKKRFDDEKFRSNYQREMAQVTMSIALKERVLEKMNAYHNPTNVQQSKD